ncbi:hypothetical protein Vretimale_14183 [Volvox reticuliferus]|uniref:Uncharacterized protein n=1 Tax=Volvox reticuliferus TaxID=1737510 RepID=A0A8J4LUE5_9CHLO|nr:hypothetical protein Vretifemale_15209 [Volvox reticuliferus]GIM10587.1 hypothetical protein Vretimale_14183 [Volvox reticuliferus]
MDYAEDATVPGGAAENFAARMGLLTRSSSRKRLSPEALAAGNKCSVPRGGALAWEPSDNLMGGTLLLGYHRCPGGDDHPDTVRMQPGCRGNYGKSDRVAAETAVREPTGFDGSRKNSAVARVRTEQWAQESAAFPHEVPVIAPRQVGATSAATATTAASALAASTTSIWHVPSAPQLRPPPCATPYSELLSGPGFSYAIDGAYGGADTISLGSLGSGSYILGGDDEDDGKDYDNDESEADSALFTPCGSRSAGSIYSGSGKCSEGAAVAAELSKPRTCGFQKPVVEVPNVALAGSQKAAAQVTAATTAAAISAPEVAAVAATPDNGLLGRSDGVDGALVRVDGSGDDDRRVDLGLAAAADEGDSGDKSPIRFDCIESVGSAYFEVPSSNSRARAAVSDGGIVAEYLATAAAAGDAVGGAWLPGGAPETALLSGTIGPENASGWGGNGGGPAETVVTLPQVAAPPALLPPEVYLGFINQLVESVRNVAQAMDNGCQANR